MECRIYNAELEQIGLIQSYISLDWKEEYNSVGSFTLELHQSDGLMDIIRPDFFCGIAESDTLMIIKAVIVRDRKVIASGFSALRLLDDRVCTTEISAGTVAETAIRTVVSGMTALDIITLGDAEGIETTFDGSISGGTVLEYVTEIAQAVDMGVRLRHDRAEQTLVFECRMPTVSTLRCMPEYGNVGEVEYSLSTADYKNVVTVIGATATVQAGETSATGAERRELLLDSGEEKKSSETTAAYQNRLKAIGLAELAKHNALQSLSASISDPDARLGEMAFCRFNELGLSAEVRIIGVEWISQHNRTEQRFTLGTPIIIGK